MKFHGLIITDAMDMGGVTSLYPPGEAAVRSVEAGADVLLMPPVPDAAMAGLEDAVDVRPHLREANRRIGAPHSRRQSAPRTRQESLRRVARLNEKFGAARLRFRGAKHRRPRRHAAARHSQNWFRSIPRGPCACFWSRFRPIPIRIPAKPSSRKFAPRVDSLTVLRADTQYLSVSHFKLPPPDSYDVAIAALFVRVADRKGNVGLPDDQRAFVNQLLATGKPTAVIASFGSPYLIERFPNATTWLGEFSTNDVSQRAAARAIFGQSSHRRKNPGHRSRHRETRRRLEPRGESDDAAAGAGVDDRSAETRLRPARSRRRRRRFPRRRARRRLE